MNQRVTMPLAARTGFLLLAVAALAAYANAQEPKADAAWSRLAPFFKPPAELANDTGKYYSPLRFADGRVAGTPAEWQRRRAEILADWHAMLGSWPPLLEKPKIEYLDREIRENFTQRHVHVDIAAGGKQADGYLLMPEGKGPFPAVLVVFYEAKSSIGLVDKAKGLYDFGYQLAKRGFVTLSIGTPGSIERPTADTRDLLVATAEESGRQPLSYLAYVSANCHTALAQLENVDPQRIGIVGLSYGGKWTMFASCLYEKFACAVWSDPGIVFDESNSNINYFEPWYIGYERGKERPRGVPNADKPRTGLYKQLYEAGRDLHELHALMAPRPFLVSGGSEDKPPRWQPLNHTVAVNKLLGHENRVGMTNRPGHIPTPEAAEQTCLFFEHFLKPAH